MLNDSPQLDRAFPALSDPVRRGMLARLSHGPASVSELAAPLQHQPARGAPASEGAGASGLVAVREDGPGADRAAGARRRSRPQNGWIAERRAEWEAQADRLEDYLQTLKKGETMMAEELDLVLERTLDAPVDLVWKAYTDPRASEALVRPQAL